MESKMHTNRTGKQRRCKPLLTSAVSMSAIASKVYTRTPYFDGPIGSTAKKLVNFTLTIFPFFRFYQCIFLAILSFTDNLILSLENIIQTLFPPSTKLFDKIDNYAHATENLPAKFDAVLDKYSMIIHRVSFLDWVIVYTISWLKFFISILSCFRSNASKEKEIVIDTSGNDHKKEKESIDKSFFRIDSSPRPFSVSSNFDSKNENGKESFPKMVPSKGAMNVMKPPIISDIRKCSYKEILEKGKKEEAGMKEDSKTKDQNIKSREDTQPNDINSSERNGNEDSILQLFATSWHMKPPKWLKKDSISRSASYT